MLVLRLVCAGTVEEVILRRGEWARILPSSLPEPPPSLPEPPPSLPEPPHSLLPLSRPTTPHARTTPPLPPLPAARAYRGSADGPAPSIPCHVLTSRLPHAHQPLAARSPLDWSRAPITRTARAKLRISRGTLAEAGADGEDNDVAEGSNTGGGTQGGTRRGVRGGDAAPSAAMTAEAIRYGLADLYDDHATAAHGDVDGAGETSHVSTASAGGGDGAGGTMGGATRGAAAGPTDAQIDGMLSEWSTCGVRRDTAGSVAVGTGRGAAMGSAESSAVAGGATAGAGTGSDRGCGQGSSSPAVARPDGASGGGGGEEDSIYIFDGVDYAETAIARRRAADENALHRVVLQASRAAAASGAAESAAAVVAAAAAGGRGRRHTAMSEEEAAVERARLEATAREAERVKKERAEHRKLERWRKAGYVSLSLAPPSEAETDEYAPPAPGAPASHVGGAVATRGVGGLSGAAVGGASLKRKRGDAAAQGGARAARAGSGPDLLGDDSEATIDDSDGDGGDCGRPGASPAHDSAGDGSGACMPEGSRDPPEEESDDVDVGDEDDEAGTQLRFAVGDAMTAGGAAGASPRVVLVYADASGRWPSRGFFRSVSSMSTAPQAAYEAASAQADLALGDAHWVELPEPANAGRVVCVLVVLRRDKRAPPGTPPELCAASLDAALARVGAKLSRCRGASVHSPRLAATAGGSAWYAVERLLKRNLRRTPTTVYYYRR